MTNHHQTAFAVSHTHIKTPGEPDYTQAAAWAGALTGNADTAVFNWRFIHDQNKGIPAIKRRGTLPAMWQEACNWNAAGYGIFATANEMDGTRCEPNGQPTKGQSRDTLAHVQTVRPHMVDLDNLNAIARLQRAARHFRPPPFTVHTSPNKARVYWPLRAEFRPVDLDGYRTTQRKPRQLYDGDKAVVDVTRVLRVCDFLHQKDAPAPHLWRTSTTRMMVVGGIPWAILPLQHHRQNGRCMACVQCLSTACRILTSSASPPHSNRQLGR